MKLAIFGASGGAGKPLVAQALAADHQVTALVRTPSKLGLTHPNLTIIQGDATDPQAVEKTIAGADGVISVLGPTQNAADKPITRATQNILAAMQKQNVRRLIVSVGAGVLDPNDSPDFVAKLMGALVKTFSRHVYADMLNVSEAVRASDRDWTIVRVPMLTNEPKKGRVKVAWVGKGMRRTITRADMADFMLKQAQDNTYLRQAPAISN